eukprot:6920890-Karenia_brevis.AAC.1
MKFKILLQESWPSTTPQCASAQNARCHSTRNKKKMYASVAFQKDPPCQGGSALGRYLNSNCFRSRSSSSFGGLRKHR